MGLERETETYRKNLPLWREHVGKFVLIHGDDVVDFFSTYEDAIKSGYQRFGLTAFLVKQVQTIQQVQFVSRLIVPVEAAC
jgi:hypothetical protein